VENPAFAEPMITLTKKLLEQYRKPLSVLFVISSRDRPVYNEFLSRLTDIPANRATNTSIPTLQISSILFYEILIFLRFFYDIFGFLLPPRIDTKAFSQKGTC